MANGVRTVHLSGRLAFGEGDREVSIEVDLEYQVTANGSLVPLGIAFGGRLWLPGHDQYEPCATALFSDEEWCALERLASER